MLELKSAWRKLTETFAIDQKLSEYALSRLWTAYTEDGRYYHNLGHVFQVLETAQELKGLAEDFTVVELAAWYHDVVYDSHAHDNEERSAEFARQELNRMAIPPATIEATCRIILDTKKHLPTGNAIDSQILLDCDLAILSASPAIYQNYSHRIRQEYQWVPQAEYRAGRRQVLENFLQRPEIYYTDPMYQSREQAARSNLMAEISRLA